MSTTATPVLARSHGVRATIPRSTRSAPSAGCSASPWTTREPSGTRSSLPCPEFATRCRTTNTRASCWSTRAVPAAPGSSTRSSAPSCPAAAGEAYDWIGFDPRGVGLERPGAELRFPTTSAGPRPPYDPITPRSSSAWLTQDRWHYAAGLRSDGGTLLDHVKTTDNVKDMNSIRQALGEEPDQLLRLLLRHLPRPGLRHACTRRPGSSDGARLQRRPSAGVVRREPRPGLRVRDGRSSSFFDWVARHDDAVPPRDHER